jgi:hypothetical protein
LAAIKPQKGIISPPIPSGFMSLKLAPVTQIPFKIEEIEEEILPEIASLPSA